MDGGDLLREQARRLFRKVVVSPAEWPAEAWQAVETNGLHLALLPEAAGGFGVTAAEAFGVLRAAGEAALPLPLAETMLAVRLLGEAGLARPPGPLSVAPVAGPAPRLQREGGRWRLQAELARVPWGRVATAIALLVETEDGWSLVCLPYSSWRVGHGENIAGESRDTLLVDALLDPAQIAPTAADPTTLLALGAAARCQLIAGAIAGVCAMTVRYAQDRVQFGRPIGRFQAVQQNLAVLAGQVAAAAGAADLAADSIEPSLRPLAIAAAKARAGEAAGIAAGIAHQVHGAIGFTWEHDLHRLTRRLWSWRDEFGNEAVWNLQLGRHLARSGPDRLWAEMTAL